MKRPGFLLAGLAGLLFAISLTAQKQEVVSKCSNSAAKEVLYKSIHRKTFKDSKLDAVIEKTRTGTTKKIRLDLFQRNYQEFTATLVVIKEPDAAKGISFLTWDYLDPKTPDRKWYYLPAINQYKELNDEQGKKYEDQFGFSMDIFAVDLEGANHCLVRDEQVAGKICSTVESVLKNPSDTYGARALTWVNKETLVTEKIQTFDKSGNLVKEFTLQDEKKYGKFWQEMAGTYIDNKKGQNLKFKINDAQFDSNLPDDLFLSTKLKGRAEALTKQK